ncbi:NADH dehydrogenase [ubiquinone] 1 beta subcomplex subunit 2, mitochondrial-like [Schistocerca americana]|uniref:NADH dehydrogenase [ubiquinone] 1 beta subcomplex subunit 2, mitochondrial-like n=1 Tax=Schistocerca americana TaxID=7009 RepID=UPI001F4F83FD|nr:NADH dehydrogenase [ubiquinone] 1 beta subcomplex subunit 2, mitochondrial-like [Schistocerca americana]XP_047109639.1 NADH dehydrogenase [ubiquinone] 1 beta subcomplex subunit 2, mitochondrial-like [Schistocerca piceifrons]XP_049764664.1 NADH dehydrogenase [ubiquinone] 1 beta subcomplex subunit 2, mitochondrial-like [Schistocerca cancellata]XP_049804104.1 NADH dehydrogenase [ubiquinone] 1 beta subcomplex subunit 2, mitochondrial-like [Schistocerca nitens]XP_049837494.1 NADH dehydrogenase [u
MFSSRGLLLCRRLASTSKSIQRRTFMLKPPLNGGGEYVYRSAPKPHAKITIFLAEAVGAYMWWWILWHLWHEPEHITGEFPYPDPSKWTDEELGIPPDEEE